MVKNLITSALFVFFFAAAANAMDEEQKPQEEILSLEQSIKIGLENYPKIRAAVYGKMAAQARLSEAKSAKYLPKFSMLNLFGPVPNLPPGFGPPNFPSGSTDWSEWNIFYRLKIEGIQPIYTFGKISNLIKAARGGVEIEEIQVEIEKRDLVYQIKQIYYGLMLGYSGLDLMDEMKSRLEDAKKRVHTLLEGGASDVTELDMLKLKVFEADLKRRFVDAHTQIDVGKRALSVLLGGGPSNGLDIEDKKCTPVKVTIGDAQEYYRYAKSERSELKQIKTAVEIARSAMRMARADFFPSFFLGGQFEYGVAPGRTSIDNPYLADDLDTLSGYAALGFNQNLNFFQTNSKYKKARADYRKALSQFELVSSAIMLDVRKSYEELVSAEKVIKIMRQGYKDARSYITSAFLGFDMGTVTTSKLIEAFVAYTKIKFDYISAIHAYNVAIADLTKATGHELTSLSY